MCLWEAESGWLVATFKGDIEGIHSAVLCPDGRCALATSDKTARLWPLLSVSDPPPEWCGDLLVWLGGERIAADGRIKTLSGDELLQLEARLRPHMNENSDYGRLLRWRLLAPEDRTVNPYGTITQGQTADLIIRPNLNNAEAEHAYDLDPWNPPVHLALASFEKDSIRADFLRRYSLNRLPNNPKLRRRAADLLRQKGEEDLAKKVEAQGQ